MCFDELCHGRRDPVNQWEIHHEVPGCHISATCRRPRSTAQISRQNEAGKVRYPKTEAHRVVRSKRGRIMMKLGLFSRNFESVYRNGAWTFQRGRTSKQVPECQHGYNPTRPEKPAGEKSGRMPGTRSERPVAENRQVAIG